MSQSIGSSNRNSGQIHHVDQVRVGEFGREIEPDDVEVGGGPMRVNGEQGDSPLSEEFLEIVPRGIGALSHRIRPLVDDLVEDLEALVRKSDLVGVRVPKQPSDLVGGVLRNLCTSFHADISGRFGDAGQQLFDLGPQGAHTMQRTGRDRPTGTCAYGR